MQYLTTEQSNPTSSQIDTLSAIEIVRLMNVEDHSVAAAVESESTAIARAVEKIAEQLSKGGRLLYLGAGTSGRLGVLDASECPPTFSTSPELVVGIIAGGAKALTSAIEGAEDNEQAAIDDLQRHQLGEKDVLVGIATSGRTPYVVSGLRYAKQSGAFTIGLACNRNTDLEKVADFVIAPIVGSEVISGSTRLKAGTATKMVLNILTTASMVLLGKTYGNWMVDLRSTNTKLKIRSIRIVSSITGLNESESAQLLERSNGEVKTAIVSDRHRLAYPEASALLQRCSGNLRLALESGDAIFPSEAQPKKTVVRISDASDDQPLQVLAVDGGGSKTTAWLANVFCATNANFPRIEILGRGQAGPSNPRSVGFATAFSNLEAAIAAAKVDAANPHPSVSIACLSLAGVGRIDERQKIEAWANERQLALKTMVMDDVEPLAIAAEYEQCLDTNFSTANIQSSWNSSVTLVVGTGSIAIGQNKQGERARIGGWGYLLGDEGSGFSIGLAGLHAVCMAHDRGEALVEWQTMILSQLGLTDITQLIPFIYQTPIPRAIIAKLAETIISFAKDDLTANQIVDSAIHSMADLVGTLVRRLKLQSQHYSLAISGGIFAHHPWIRDRLLQNLAQNQIVPHDTHLIRQPIHGPLIVAGRVALS